MYAQREIWLPTLLFVVVNPIAEEGYWRGLLLDTAGKNRWLVVFYSSVLFVINHMWMSITVIGARNPTAWGFQFVFGLLMSVVYLRARSLRWPIAAHFLANLLTPTVPIFMNLYIPGVP